MKISGITCFHVNIHPEGVCFRVDFVNLCRIFKFLQDFSRADPPSVHLDCNEGRRVIVGLQKAIGIEMCGQVRRDQLRVLAAGLRYRVSKAQHKRG